VTKQFVVEEKKQLKRTMADNNASQQTQNRPKGFSNLIRHMTADYLGVGLWLTRIITIVLALFGYILPLLGGFFGDPIACYYKTLMAAAATSALRLHQRMPRIQLNQEFIATIVMEDSAHYLMFCLIFIFFSSPITTAILPVSLFAILHSASYSLTLLDALGAPSSAWGIRFLISIVELQSRNILRMIAFTEIFLMPITVLNVFRGVTWLVAPLVYFRFLGLRYSSRRNPYTRNVFYMLRMSMEKTAEHPNLPSGAKSMIHKLIHFVSGLAPMPAAP